MCIKIRANNTKQYKNKNNNYKNKILNDLNFECVQEKLNDGSGFFMSKN